MKYHGNEMAQYVLQSNGRVVPRHTLNHIPLEERRTKTVQHQMAIFDNFIREKLGDSLNKPPVVQEDIEWNPYKDDEQEARVILKNDVKLGKLHISLANSLINAEVLLHQGKEGNGSDGPIIKARVLCHLTDDNGNFVGTPNEDPKLDTTVYKVEFPDGCQESYATNVIGQEIYYTGKPGRKTQCGSGRHNRLPQRSKICCQERECVLHL